jgi:hypothetical protein
MVKTSKTALAMIMLPFLAIPLSVAQNATTPVAILPGGVVVPFYPPGSTFLNSARVREAEQFNMSQAVPGRINSIVNIHNPSIEVHTVFFYNYGVNTIILRSRLRRDGYNPQTDEVYDAQQSIRLVRAHAHEWNIDPNKIIPFGTWQFRFIDWFRDLGFLQPPGVETKAAKDIAFYLSQPGPTAQ